MVATKPPPNGKGIFDVGGTGVNVTIVGFALSGAEVSSGNGAGIRYEGGNLTLVNDYVHDNQDWLAGQRRSNRHDHHQQFRVRS